MTTEFNKFNQAMAKILRADPKAVKASMEDDKRLRAEARKTKRAAAPGQDDPA